MRVVGLICTGIFCAVSATAQLPTCATPGIVYLHNGSTINNFDQNQPLSATNPSPNTITMPGGAGGLAVGPNINAPAPSPTFYTTVGGNYYYYDGTTWVNTGHGTGSGAAVNIGAGGGFIYNLVGASGEVYKYDGTGPGTLLTTVTGFAGGGPYDLVADVAGNWYILKMTTGGIGQFLRKYSPTGALITQWTINGVAAPGPSAGGGFAVICDSIFVNGGGSFYRGYIDNATSSITLTQDPAGPSASDWASCPAGTGAGSASVDTGYYCGSGPGVPVSVIGGSGGIITWSVLSGNAVINGSGPNITVTATSGVSRILLEVTGVGQGLCSNGTDTVTIIVPTATVDAGTSPDSIEGCGVYTKSLNASVFNTTPGVTYNYSWAPSAAIASGGNTLQPVITPFSNTQFILFVSTDASQGGCTWTDTVDVVTVDRSVVPDFDFVINYGCDEDTVQFNNLSTGGDFYRWDFSDGTGDTATNPLKIYPMQNSYNVKLVVDNGVCIDSVTKIVDTQHPLVAGFSPDLDSICEGTMVTFTNTSTYTNIDGDAKFFWSFGDGGTDTTLNATYTFTRAGVYEVMMVVTDFVPCSDTAYATISVDSMPVLSFTTSDSVLCEGQRIEFLAGYSESGLTSLTWDFGDGKTITEEPITTHGYDTSGVFTVTLTGTYRICPTQVFTKNIDIYPFPSLNLGSDTTICPNGEAIMLGDIQNQFSNGRWRWNTGDTTAFIAVRHPGTYTARVSMNGCSTDDSVLVRKDCYLDVPNSFTPNNDGTNDYFLPRQLMSAGVTNFKMTIFNRWGQVVFETTTFNGRGWDGMFNGKEQPSGVYVYQIEATFKNGVKEQYQGNLTLLR